MLDPLFDVFTAVLAWFYSLWPSYGMAVAFLTLTTTIAVTPLTLKSTRSTLQMQQHMPELKRLQSQYKGDRQAMNEATAAFYKQHSVNPVGCLLPMLVQMPIFLVMYRVVHGLTRRTTEVGTQLGFTSRRYADAAFGAVPEYAETPVLRDELTFDPDFLSRDTELYVRLSDNVEMVSWGVDLSRSASSAISESIILALPYLLMILVVLVTSLLQQRQIQGRQSAAAMPPQQQMMMKLIPYMLPVFSYAMPAAVVTYFIISNLVRIAQQAYITRSFYRGEDSLGSQIAKQRDATANQGSTEAEAGEPSPKSVTERKGAPTPKRDAATTRGRAPARKRDAATTRGRAPARKRDGGTKRDGSPPSPSVLPARGAPPRPSVLPARGAPPRPSVLPARGAPPRPSVLPARGLHLNRGLRVGGLVKLPREVVPLSGPGAAALRRPARVRSGATRTAAGTRRRGVDASLVHEGHQSVMEWLEISAASVESAKERALTHLGVHESEAEFEVLSEGRVGLFGRIRREARVRARVIPTPVRSKEGKGRGHNSRKAGSGSARRSEAARPAGSASPQPQSNARANRRAPTNPSTDARPRADNGPRDSGSIGRRRGSNDKENGKPMMDHDTGPSLLEQADLAESFVRGVADTVGVSLAFTRHDVEDGIMRIEADGEGIGLLVGRRGATAQALDELVRTVLQRSGGTTREGKIRIDVGGIRTRRAAALADFTRKVAQEALESGEQIALEPMNRVDRKIVHDAITEFEQLESRSEGEDPHRRVIIGVQPD